MSMQIQPVDVGVCAWFIPSWAFFFFFLDVYAVTSSVYS